jgi:hypothetical protein
VLPRFETCNDHLTFAASSRVIIIIHLITLVCVIIIIHMPPRVAPLADLVLHERVTRCAASSRGRQARSARTAFRTVAHHESPRQPKMRNKTVLLLPARQLLGNSTAHN